LKPVQRLVGINIASEIVGLSVIVIATVLMVFGSLAFPDRGASSELRSGQK
jgi:hypothetical protein